MTHTIILLLSVCNAFLSLAAQNIGIGTITPADKLTVQAAGYGITHTFGTATIGTWIGNFQGITTAKFGTKTDHSLHFFTANSAPQMTLSTTGNLGIGTEAPTEKLSVQTDNNSYGISHRGNSGNILATYIGGTSAGIGTFSNTNMRIYSNGVGAIFVASGTNNVGIGVDFPANKLQIGSMGGSGFATNDFAIGNGTSAMAIYLTDASTLIGSTNDIVLRPRNNGHGRVGININSPRAPLDVLDGINIEALNSYYSYFRAGLAIKSSIDNPVPNVSIMASGRVYANEFDVYSDARIKNVTGTSNATSDLESINSLQIRDYTMKDKIKYGDKPFKKVIAQEVEKVYPQIVSKHTDFIPNVYQLTSRITKTADGYLLSFTNDHHISSNAKKVQVLLADEGSMKQFDIVSIPSGNEIVINATDIKGDKIFVYGEEVDDFRTVDYEGLTTLNISATQELSRQLKQQQKMNETQNKRIAELEAILKIKTNKTAVKFKAD